MFNKILKLQHEHEIEVLELNHRIEMLEKTKESEIARVKADCEKACYHWYHNECEKFTERMQKIVEQVISKFDKFPKEASIRQEIIK